MVFCLKCGAHDLHMVQLMPLHSVVSFFIKIQIGLTFLVTACPGCPGRKAIQWVLWSFCVQVSGVRKNSSVLKQRAGCNMTASSNIQCLMFVTKNSYKIYYSYSSCLCCLLIYIR